MRTQREGGARK
jgi:hypothetical protein